MRTHALRNQYTTDEVNDLSLNGLTLDNRWIALHVRSGWELKSARGLRERGYEEFVPTYHEERRWSDRVKFVQTPFFAGYVFLRFDSRNRQPIVSVPGFLRFIGVGAVPSPIEDAEIEALKIASKMNAKCEPCFFPEVGQLVVVRTGPLLGLRGKVVRFKNRDRFVISVSLLKMSVFVEIGGSDISAASLLPSTAHDMPPETSASQSRDYTFRKFF